MLRKRLGNREEFMKILPRDYPVYIDKVGKLVVVFLTILSEGVYLT